MAKASTTRARVQAANKDADFQLMMRRLTKAEPLGVKEAKLQAMREELKKQMRVAFELSHRVYDLEQELGIIKQ